MAPHNLLLALILLTGSLQTQAQTPQTQAPQTQLPQTEAPQAHAPKQHPRHENPANPFSGLDTAFNRILKEFHASGFAVGVIKKDSLIYAKGFGYRDYEKKLPVTPHTLFAIGSCTKAFTASLIGLLETENKVNLDKPVRDYLPELHFYTEAMNNTITLRDLMCHRTGLPRYDYSWYLFRTDSRDSLLQRIRYMEPTAPVREKWQYNNFMFMAQGMVVEKLTGQSWEANITDKIFRPLGMNESVLSIEDMIKQPDYSLGYGLKHDTGINKLDYFKDIHGLAPAGAISSNVLDMSEWLKVWINGGKYKKQTIIPASYVNEAITPQMVIGGGLPSTETPDVYFSTYGFGWVLSSYRGHYRAEHGGNIDGFSADASLYPTDSLAIIVLSNQNGSPVPAIVRNLLVDRLLHLPYKDWTTLQRTELEKAIKATRQALKTRTTDRKQGTHPSHPLANYTGLYDNPAYGTFEVSLKNDSLFATIGKETWWLKHYHYDIFESLKKDPQDGYDTTDVASLKLQFNMDLTGDIASVSAPFEPTLSHPIEFKRTYKTKALDSTELLKYQGQYDFGPLAAKVYLKGKTLYLFVPGQPEYELVNVGPDKFKLKPLEGYYTHFILDAVGHVTAMEAIQPNGTFKATKK